MRIDGPGRANAAGSGSGARRTDAASTFTLPSDPGRARTAAVSTPGGAYDVAALMALQSVEGPLEKRRKAVRRGFDLLDTLDDIRIDLLSGTMPPERLERLVELLGQTSGADDARVDALIGDIELRARVELAKRGRYPD